MKNSRTVFLVALFSLLVFMGVPSELISADQNQVKEEVKQTLKQETNKPENPYATAKISIKIIPAIHKTYGYDILVSGKPLIHQPSIPGLPGNEGFKTKKKAQEVAEFVVKKIRKNEMPPTVTVEDLKRMKVLNE